MILDEFLKENWLKMLCWYVVNIICKVDVENFIYIVDLEFFEVNIKDMDSILSRVLRVIKKILKKVIRVFFFFKILKRVFWRVFMIFYGLVEGRSFFSNDKYVMSCFFSILLLVKCCV